MDRGRERLGFTWAFDDDNVVAVEESERPDFIALLSRRQRIGVEITEVFENDSHARLEKIPQYGETLLRGGAFRHKDDVQAINLATVSLSEPDTNQFAGSFRAIVSEVPHPHEHYDTVAASIESKNLLCSGYRRDVEAHVLVVIDHIPGGPKASTECQVSDVITSRMRAALSNSPFAEVVVLNVSRKGHETLLRAKALLLYDWVNLAAEPVEGFAQQWRLDSAEMQHAWASTLRELDVDALLRQGSNGPEIMWGPLYFRYLGEANFAIGEDFGVNTGDCVTPRWPTRCTGPSIRALIRRIRDQVGQLTSIGDVVFDRSKRVAAFPGPARLRAAVEFTAESPESP